MNFGNEDLDRLRLIRTESVGPVTYRRLMQRFTSPEAAIAALPELARAGGRSATPQVPTRATVERELVTLSRMNARLIFQDRPDYPPFLATLTDAPSALAVMGDVALLSRPSIGIVGARNASANGMRMATQLAEELAPHLTIVSGLARGIDAASHRGALTAGRTIAVIAGGLDSPYPQAQPDHRRAGSGARGDRSSRPFRLFINGASGQRGRARDFRRARLASGPALQGRQ